LVEILRYKVAFSIPGGVIDLIIPTLTEMSARDISWMLMRQVSRTDNFVIFMHQVTGKFWEPQPPAVLMTCPGLYMYSFTFVFTSTSILTQSRSISYSCHPGDGGDGYCSDNCWFIPTSFFMLSDFIRMKHLNFPGNEGCSQLMGLLYACLKCTTFTYDYSLSKRWIGK